MRKGITFEKKDSPNILNGYFVSILESLDLNGKAKSMIWV